MIVENNDSMPVRELQSMLRNVSYYVDDVLRVVPDGNFSEDTKNSLLSFQKAYGLPQTGQADFLTWQKLRDVSNHLENLYQRPRGFKVVGDETIISRGDIAPELYVLQAMLYNILLGFDDSPTPVLTGVHDENSVESVVYVQRLSGFEPTGVIDVPTYNLIGDLYESRQRGEA